MAGLFFSEVYEKMAEGTRSLYLFAALYLTANFVKVTNRKLVFGSRTTSNCARDINICRKPSTPTAEVMAPTGVWDDGVQPRGSERLNGVHQSPHRQRMSRPACSHLMVTHHAKFQRVVKICASFSFFFF